jgi:hypothetical protein
VKPCKECLSLRDSLASRNNRINEHQAELNRQKIELEEVRSDLKIVNTLNRNLTDALCSTIKLYATPKWIVPKDSGLSEYFK